MHWRWVVAVCLFACQQHGVDGKGQTYRPNQTPPEEEMPAEETPATRGDKLPSGPTAATFAPPPAATVGTRQKPITINASELPVDFTDSRNMAKGAQLEFMRYSPSLRDEAGPETVYTFTASVPVIINVSTTASVQLLSKLVPGSTQTLLTAGARGDGSLALSVPEGTYFLVVDTNSAPGPFTVRVQLDAIAAVGSPNTCGNPTTSCVKEIIPAPNGVPEEIDYQNGCPPGMDAVDGFCIDRYEAMLVGIDVNGNPFSWSPYENPKDYYVIAKSVPGAIPQGYINRPQAADACAYAGKRLCTSNEWLRACKGSAGNTYPYGSTRQDGVCNDARSQHPAVQYFGTGDACVWSNINNACINQLPNGLALTGNYTGCVTADGQRDMMGNLHEWVSDSASNGNGIFRGGYYVDTKLNGEGCNYKTTAHALTHWDYSTGFRCCY